MKKIVLTWGLVSGLIVSSFMAVSMVMCYNNPNYAASSAGMLVGYLSMLIAFSFIYVGVKSFRDKYNGGVISFGKAFTTGLLISLIASTMYVVVWAIVYNFFLPNFMDIYTEHMITEAKATGSAKILAEKTAQVQGWKDMYKNPFLFTLMTYAEILPVGILVSLICALLLKKSNRVMVQPA